MSISQSRMRRLRHVVSLRVIVVLLLIVGGVLVQGNLIINPPKVAAQSSVIEFDSYNSNDCFNCGSSGSPLTWHHTVGPGFSNGILIVGISIMNPPTSTVTATVMFGTQPLTLLGTHADPGTQVIVGLWYLLNPSSSSSGTITVTLNPAPGTGSNVYLSGGSVSYFNVASVGCVTSSDDGGVMSSTASVTVTCSNSGDLVVDTIGINQPSVSLCTKCPAVYLEPDSVGQMERWFIGSAAASDKPDASPVTMEWSALNAATNNPVNVAWSLIAVPLTPTSPPLIPLCPGGIDLSTGTLGLGYADPVGTSEGPNGWQFTGGPAGAGYPTGPAISVAPFAYTEGLYGGYATSIWVEYRPLWITGPYTYSAGGYPSQINWITYNSPSNILLGGTANAATGTYNYQITFTATAPGTFYLIAFSADNAAQLKLQGNTWTSPGYPTALTIQAKDFETWWTPSSSGGPSSVPLSPGTYTLTATVENSPQGNPNVSGLAVYAYFCNCAAINGAGLQAWWKLDETAGATSVVDSSGNGNNGVPTTGSGTPTKIGSPFSPFHVKGEVGGALQFYPGYVQVPNSASLNFGTNGFTIDNWVYLYPYVSSTDWGGLNGPAGTIVDKWVEPLVIPAQYHGYLFYINQPGGGLYGPGKYTLNLRMNNLLFTSNSVGPVTIGGWYHIAVTVEYNPNTVTFYQDGVNITPAGGLTFTTAGKGALSPISVGSTVSLWIGRSRPHFNYNTEIRLDDIEIWNRPLFQSEILSIYNAGSAGKCPIWPQGHGSTIVTELNATTIHVASYGTGDTVFDSAVLFGVTSTAGGTVTYYWFSGSSCGGTPTLVNTVTVTDGNVPPSNVISFASAGTYSWYAVYSGDSNNPGGTSACEGPLTVTQ